MLGKRGGGRCAEAARLPTCTRGSHTDLRRGTQQGGAWPHPTGKASPPPTATAERLLQSDFFCLKVNRQHILAKRNSAFWMAPAMCTDDRGVFPPVLSSGRGAVTGVGGWQWQSRRKPQMLSVIQLSFS